MPAEYLTVNEIAEKLNLSQLTIRRYIKANKIKAYKLGREYRVEIKDFEDFLKKLKKSSSN